MKDWSEVAVEDQVTAYLLGDLPEALCGEVRALLEEDEACAVLAGELEGTLGLLRGGLDGRALERDVLTELAQERVRQEARFSLRRWLAVRQRPFVDVAAALLIFAVGAALFFPLLSGSRNRGGAAMDDALIEVSLVDVDEVELDRAPVGFNEEVPSLRFSEPDAPVVVSPRVEELYAGSEVSSGVEVELRRFALAKESVGGVVLREKERGLRRGRKAKLAPVSAVPAGFDVVSSVALLEPVAKKKDVAMPEADGDFAELVLASPVGKTVEAFDVEARARAYGRVREAVLKEDVLNVGVVDVADFMNFFDYGYAAPEEGAFKVYAEQHVSPWGAERVLCVCLKGAGVVSDLALIARDVRVCIEVDSVLGDVLVTKEVRSGESHVVLIPLKGALEGGLAGFVSLRYLDVEAEALVEVREPLVLSSSRGDGSSSFKLAVGSARFAELLGGDALEREALNDLLSYLWPVTEECPVDAKFRELVSLIQRVKGF